MANVLAIQSADKRAKGIGWKAEPCPDPISFARGGLCVPARVAVSIQ